VYAFRSSYAGGFSVLPTKIKTPSMAFAHFRQARLPLTGNDDAAGFLNVRTVHLLAARGDFVMALRRSGLPFRRPPATGLLGHYPDRTLNCKPITASQDTPEVVAPASQDRVELFHDFVHGPLQ